MMDQYLPGTSVVITGASSGIGRAAALAFAHRGARVALAARRAGPLHDVASKCRRIGGDAIAVATDVTDAEAVAQLAQAAELAFGRIDVWINNAGTGVFGAYTNADVALHRRIIEVNLLGSMHGVATVLPIFLRQGHGALINNISMGAGPPYRSPRPTPPASSACAASPPVFDRSWPTIPASMSAECSRP
jgi:NADP-dependent 3-hydroxy acid dehydrogenase YdfG